MVAGPIETAAGLASALGSIGSRGVTLSRGGEPAAGIEDEGMHYIGETLKTFLAAHKK